MLTKRIIPCLDVNQGRVVKGTNFVNLVDAGDPVELADIYNKEGADELVFLDITASSDKRAILLDVVEKTASKVFIPLTVGGGINNIQSIQDLLHAGADKVSINTGAVKTPSLISEASEKYGSQCIVVAIDARACEHHADRINLPPHLPTHLQLTEESQWEVYTHGGRTPTGIDAVKWALYMASLGAGEVLLTSMDKDGTKTGYDIPLTKAISTQLSIPVIASGGAGSCEHISDALTICEAALLASLLHFRELSIHDIKTHCLSQGLPIRH